MEITADLDSISPKENGGEDMIHCISSSANGTKNLKEKRRGIHPVKVFKYNLFTCCPSFSCATEAYLGTRPGMVGMKNGADFGTFGGSLGLFLCC